MAFKKLFTLQEANSFVPQLLELVPLIQKLSTSLHNDFPDIKNYYAFDRYIDTLDCQYSEECNIDYIFGNLNHDNPALGTPQCIELRKYF